MTYFFGMSQSYVFGMSYSFKRANTFLVYNYIQETYLEYTKNTPKILCEYIEIFIRHKSKSEFSVRNNFLVILRHVTNVLKLMKGKTLLKGGSISYVYDYFKKLKDILQSKETQK